MAVLSNTGTATPVVGSETTVAGWTIAPGAPLDNISVYFVGGTGGGGGPLLLRLYAEVGGFQTLVALKQVVGSNLPSIIAWDTGLGPLAGGGGGGLGGGNATAQTNKVHAGGTAYTLTIEDLSNVPASLSTPRLPVTMTLAGVNQFDTAADMNFGELFALTPGSSDSLPVFDGYAQSMDVAIDQTDIPPFFIVTVTADCGPGSVMGATIASAQMSGTDSTIGSVFRNLDLPVATRYFVNITNKSQETPSLVLTGVTSSVAATSGGAVVLGGDVIGPSSANTVIKWDNVPLTLVGVGNFGAPTDAAIPIYNIGTNKWSALTISGDGTLSDTGVLTVTGGSFVLGGDVTGPSGANTVGKWENVPLDPASMGAPAIGSIPVFTANAPNHWVATPPGAIVVALTGNINGPSNANEWTSFVTEATGAPVVLPNPVNGGWTYIGISGLVGPPPQLITLPAIPVQGMVVVVTDEDGSLTAGSIAINGNGKGVQGNPTLVLDTAYPGPFGSVALQYDATAATPGWFIFADYAKNAASSATLVGNANGPAGANSVEDFGIESVNNVPPVTAASFTPIAKGQWYVGISGIPAGAGPIPVQLQDTFPPGSRVTIKDEDGSLANGDINVTGSAADTIDGLLTYVLDVASPGPFGAVTIEKNFNTPPQWSVVVQ